MNERVAQRIQETHKLIGHVVCELGWMILFPHDMAAKETE